jgi:putative tryptophan/tyrosine transport system substrate-binding protein
VGEKLADIPVEQAEKFVTNVNITTTKAIGIEVPTTVLLRTDEMIE